MSRHPRTEDTDEGLLSRWSRRKRGLERTGHEAPGEAAPGEPGPAAAAEETQPEAPEQVKTDADMPDLSTISDATDMSDFFSPGVSEELRNQALRRLFHLAKFNVTDGLDDYCGDFRNFQPLGDIVTADMRHRMEVEKQRLAEKAREEAADTADTSEEEAAEEQEASGGSERQADDDLQSTETVDADQDEPEDDEGEVTRT